RRLRQLADLLDEGKGRHIVARELLASAPQLGEDLRGQRPRIPLRLGAEGGPQSLLGLDQRLSEASELVIRVLRQWYFAVPTLLSVRVQRAQVRARSGYNPSPLAARGAEEG